MNNNNNNNSSNPSLGSSWAQVASNAASDSDERHSDLSSDEHSAANAMKQTSSKMTGVRHNEQQAVASDEPVMGITGMNPDEFPPPVEAASKSSPTSSGVSHLLNKSPSDATGNRKCCIL